MLNYTPEPIDNRSIELSPELHSLIEMLARNNHELWGSSENLGGLEIRAQTGRREEADSRTGSVRGAF